MRTGPALALIAGITIAGWCLATFLMLRFWDGPPIHLFFMVASLVVVFQECSQRLDQAGINDRKVQSLALAGTVAVGAAGFGAVYLVERMMVGHSEIIDFVASRLSIK